MAAEQHRSSAEPIAERLAHGLHQGPAADRAERPPFRCRRAVMNLAKLNGNMGGGTACSRKGRQRCGMVAVFRMGLLKRGEPTDGLCSVGTVKRKKRPAKKAAPSPVRVVLQRVEIKTGHDGLLRGKPEPVILLAAYAVDSPAHPTVGASGTAIFIGEAMARLHPRKPFPTQVAPLEDVAISVDLRQVRVPADASHLLILAVALEEDSSADVQRLYKQLTSPDSLFLWDGTASIPLPIPLAGAARWTHHDALSTYSVHVMNGAVDVAEQCSGDTFVAAQAVVATRHSGRQECRLHFVSADRRNDWVAWLQVQC